MANGINDENTIRVEAKQLGKASFGAMLGVLFSRASGVLRTAVVNATFGLSASLDAFNTAFRFPNSLRDLLADGALSAAFVKVFVEERANGAAAEQKLIQVVLGFFLFVTLSIAFLSMFYSLEFMNFISGDQFKQSGNLELASQLFKILGFFLPITMLNAVAMAILSTLGKTFRAMNSSIFLNIGIIGSALCSPFFSYFSINPIYAIAVGAMTGAFLQMIYQFIPLFNLGLIRFPSFNISEWLKYKPLHEILVLMIPRAIAQGALVIALMINTYFAISLGSGVLSYIMTAIIIIQVPIGLFGVATGFAAHPVLTQAIHEGKTLKFSSLLTESLETVLWLSSITTLCFALLIVPFYTILFQHGKVTDFDTIQNSIAVCSYSIGITFAAGSKIILNAFYAINATSQIVYNAIIYLVVNATLSSILAPKYGIIGLGVSYSISTAIDFFMNYYFFKRKYQGKFFGDHPYIQGGRFFNLKIILFSFSAFLIGIFGILMTQNFWHKFQEIFAFKMNFFLHLLFLSIGGLCIVLLSGILITKFGPQNLKIFLKKIPNKLLR